jgi:hypothetical protein
MALDSPAKRFNFVDDPITGTVHPAAYPGSKSDTWEIPADIKTAFNQLNSIIETKYSREYLKICAFYNKLFPSLKMSAWTRTSYNVPPFTALDQERTDTGTGISANYLKQTIDQVVARLGTIDFDAQILAEQPTLEYIIYKDEVERLLRKVIRDDDMSAKATEVFHDAAIVGYSHMIIDPFTHGFTKVNDYEAGFFEGQFNRGTIRQFLYRDYAFPSTELVPYLQHCDEATRNKIIDEFGDRQTVDFKMYFDCPSRKVWIIINGTPITPKDYPFDEVQMASFCWDIGFSKVTSTSLFDLLYPCQRELNKMMAKLQQMLRLYKGAIPVFPSDVELAMKAITNGSGEALYVNSTVPVDKMITVINPTPLDPALGAEIQARKTEMQELAGVQAISFDMENMRSAAAVIALDQTRDTVFQAQMAGLARFIKKMFKVWVHYNAGMEFNNPGVSWSDIDVLLENSVIELKPVHLNDPLGNKANTPDQPKPDYEAILVNKLVLKILKGEFTFDDCTYMVDQTKLLPLLAITMVRLQAIGVAIPESAERFLIAAFVQGIQEGGIELNPPVEEEGGEEPPPEEGAPGAEEQG